MWQSKAKLASEVSIGLTPTNGTTISSNISVSTPLRPAKTFALILQCQNHPPVETHDLPSEFHHQWDEVPPDSTNTETDTADNIIPPIKDVSISRAPSTFDETANSSNNGFVSTFCSSIQNTEDHLL